MADNVDPDNAPKGSTCETATTVNKGWISKDLELLRSGLHADAEIICKYNVSRKVHRLILESRSAWFKKAFSDADMQEGNCKIKLEESAKLVDMILYFFYVGHIDLADEALTGGFGDIITIVDFMRLGEVLGEKNMQDHGKDLLVTHLTKLLDFICDTSVEDKEKDARLWHQSCFPVSFCYAVLCAFDDKEPIPNVQRILADFISAGRIYFFKDKCLSSAFEGNGTIQHQEDMKSISASPPSHRPEPADVPF